MRGFIFENKHLEIFFEHAYVYREATFSPWTNILTTHVCIYERASVPSIQMKNKAWHGKLLFYNSSLPFKSLFLRKESHLVSRILYRYFILIVHNILQYILLV